jgi:hypothetical protein
MINHVDFSVMVTNKALARQSWGWEIYRAGRTSPIERSKVGFGTVKQAKRAGKRALDLLLSEYQD